MLLFKKKTRRKFVGFFRFVNFQYVLLWVNEFLMVFRFADFEIVAVANVNVFFALPKRSTFFTFVVFRLKCNNLLRNTQLKEFY